MAEATKKVVIRAANGVELICDENTPLGEVWDAANEFRVFANTQIQRHNENFDQKPEAEEPQEEENADGSAE